MTLQPLDLLTLALATGYLSYVIVYTDGLGDMFKFIRAHDPTSVTHCIFCLAFWVALALLALYTLTPLGWLVQTFALAGGALMLASFSGMRQL